MVVFVNFLMWKAWQSRSSGKERQSDRTAKRRTAVSSALHRRHFVHTIRSKLTTLLHESELFLNKLTVAQLVML